MEVDVLGDAIEIDESYVAATPSEIQRQVREYERGDRRTFDLQVSFPDGLTGDVMRAMAAIPYGETRTYGEIAADLDTVPIAVGGACGRNPVPVVVPCHRVVRTGGHLGGYTGGLDRKRFLLRLEGAA